MSWLNGRSGDLVFSGVFVADIGGSIGIGSLYEKRPGLTTRAFMDDLGVDLTISSVTCSLTGGKFRVAVTGDLIAKTPWGNTTTSVSWFSETTPPTRNTDVRSMGGTWSITIPVEDIEENISVSGSYGGTEVLGDGPLPQKIRVLRQLDEGGTVTVTATLGGYTATKTHVIASGDVTGIDHYCTALVTAGTAQEGAVTPSLTVSTTRVYCSGDMPLQTSRSATNAGHSASAGTGSLSVTCANPGSSTAEVLCTASATCDWPKEYTFAGRLRRWDSAGTDALVATARTKLATDYDIAASSGLWGYDAYQYKEAVAFNLDGSTSSWSMDEQSPVWVYLKNSSLTTFVEDTADWRCLISGVAWDWADLVHAGTVTVEDGSSASDWAAGSNTTVSATGGAIRLVVAGGTGSGTMTPASVVLSEGHRYLRVRIKAVGAAKPFTITIGSKTWTSATVGAGAYSNIDLDLCAPDGISGTDSKSSRYALTGPAGAGGVPVDTQMWGVSRITTLIVGALENGETYEIDSISLVRNSFAQYSLASAFNNFSLAWTSGSDNTYHKPFWWSNVDGRVTDQPDVFYIVPFVGTPSYNRYTLSELVTEISEVGGWTVTELSTFPDSYHTNSLDAYHAGGAGATINHSTDVWTNHIDVDATGTVTIKAQALWDQVDVPPLWGDGWNRGSYPQGSDVLATRQTPLHWNKILRAHAWGLVYHSDRTPASAHTVNMLRASDNANRGTDSTDAQGYFVTTTPYGQAPIAHKTEALGGSYTDSTYTTANRMRHRAAFMAFASTTGTGPSLWVGPDGVHFRAYISGGTVWVGWADNAYTAGYADADTGYSANSVCIRGNPRSKNRELYLWYENGGTVYQRTSTDRGDTWSVSTTIATGVTPAGEVCIDGLRLIYYVVTGAPNLVKVIRYDMDGNSLGAATTAVSGVDNSGIAVNEFCEPTGIRKIELLCVVSGSITRYTSTDGLTFA
jgi:hypothetical protein